MIQKLSVRNYALIEHLTIDFNRGFSVLTGETGAGKSILLGALSLILGQRADTKSIKDVTQKCVIEGSFDITHYALQSYFTANELEYDPAQTILRREIHPSGKSRAFINDTPVTLAQLKELGEQLIDIHSQHQNLLLGSDRFQLSVVDALAATAPQLARYQEHYHRYKELARQLAALRKSIAASREEEDYLRFQLEQLLELKLQAGEQEPLEQELELLTHAEEIKSELFAANAYLTSDEAGALSQLKAALTRLQQVTPLYPEMEELAARLQSNYIDIKDIASECDRAEEHVTVNPERLMQLQERLNALYQLQQKHRVTSIEELLQLQENLDERLQAIDSSDHEIETLTQALEEQEQSLQAAANELTQARQAAANPFAEQLIASAKPLGLPNLRFEVSITPKEMDSYGADAISFLFSANKNQPLHPIAQVASGGEISRIMLSIKSLIANAVALPTIIFDEIDTGVSGDIADKMGGIMQQMSHFMQVLTITHLPQVASKGTTHYKVYKEDVEESTLSHIITLTPAERVEEIARMLSGSELTQAAIENAQTLLKG